MLEKFYNERFKQPGDPDFKDLPKDYKKAIEGTLAFATYSLTESVRELKEAVIDAGFGLGEGGEFNHKSLIE